MASTFICKACKKRSKKSVHLKKGQHYCGSPGCQQARKTKWEREKIRGDVSYRNNRRQSDKKWRKDEGYLYQRNYRKKHPESVKSTRKKQLEEPLKEEIFDTPHDFVKTDASFSKRPVASGFYALFPYRPDASGKMPDYFVKMDALIVQLTGIQPNGGYLPSDSS